MSDLVNMASSLRRRRTLPRRDQVRMLLTQRATDFSGKPEQWMTSLLNLDLGLVASISFAERILIAGSMRRELERKQDHPPPI